MFVYNHIELQPQLLYELTTMSIESSIETYQQLKQQVIIQTSIGISNTLFNFNSPYKCSHSTSHIKILKRHAHM